MKPDEIRAAGRFFKLLGEPDNHKNDVVAWARVMRDCLNETKYDLQTFAEFLDYAVNTDKYATEYLRIASDPAGSLKKNLSSLTRFFEAYKARKDAMVKREAELNPKPPVLPKMVRTCDPNCTWCHGSGRSNPHRPGGACECNHWFIDGKSVSLYDYDVARGVNFSTTDPKLIETLKEIK